MELKEHIKSINQTNISNILDDDIKDIEVFLLPESYYKTITNFSFDTLSCKEIDANIDILEQSIWELSPALLNLLLQDKTKGENIKWACDEYLKYGKEYSAEKETC